MYTEQHSTERNMGKNGSRQKKEKKEKIAF